MRGSSKEQMHRCLTKETAATVLMALACIASMLRQADILLPYPALWYLKFVWILPLEGLLRFIPYG